MPHNLGRAFWPQLDLGLPLVLSLGISPLVQHRALSTTYRRLHHLLRHTCMVCPTTMRAAPGIMDNARLRVSQSHRLASSAGTKALPSDVQRQKTATDHTARPRVTSCVSATMHTAVPSETYMQCHAIMYNSIKSRVHLPPPGQRRWGRGSRLRKIAVALAMMGANAHKAAKANVNPCIVQVCTIHGASCLLNILAPRQRHSAQQGSQACRCQPSPAANLQSPC